MAHDVFISHSGEDKPAADAVCAILEGQGVRCWIAPRDILPGADWGESIVHAIGQSRLLLLVFSTNANRSKQIKREVEVAADSGVTIVPLRIEDIVPTESLKYFLGNIHWMDAVTPPIERHLQGVAEKVKATLAAVPSATAREAATGAAASTTTAGRPVARAVSRRPLTIAIAAGAVLAAVAAGYVWQGRSGGVDLSGTWKANDGGTYLIEQRGDKVTWVGGNRPHFENRFEGVMKDGSLIEGQWQDLPGNRIFGSGRLTLRVETPMRLVAVSQTGGFAGTVWVRG